MRFLSYRHATIAKKVLDVDQELQPDRQAKTMQINGSTLHVCVFGGGRASRTQCLSSPHSRGRALTASDAKSLRVCLSSFFDLALVVTKNLQEVRRGAAVAFSPDVSLFINLCMLSLAQTACEFLHGSKLRPRQRPMTVAKNRMNQATRVFYTGQRNRNDYDSAYSLDISPSSTSLSSML